MKLIASNKWFSVYKEYKKSGLQIEPKIFEYSDFIPTFDYFVLKDCDNIELEMLFMRAYIKYLRLHGTKY